MFHSTGLIPGARVVVATTGLIWEQKGQVHSPLRAHMEGLDVLVSEEAQQDMDLKSAFVPAVPRQPFFRILLGDPRHSPGGVADNLKERRTLLLKAPIRLRAKHRWLMPQELPKVACSLLKESGEASLQELVQAAEEVSGKALGSGRYSREYRPSTMPAGANLQAAYPELRNIQLDTPEGLIAGLGYALTRPGHMFQFHQANTAEERSGLAGVHQWSIMLPTSARVAQEVYEPLIGIHYPMLCNVKNGNWQIGTGSIRAESQLASGFRFVNWVHDVSDPEIRAVPPPEATNTVYRQIEQWLPMTDRETDHVLALTTRTLSAQHLQGFFQQSGRRANAETAVKVTGATAKHCVVLRGKSTFLSGTSRGNDLNHECYTRANVAYSRATDLTVSACPVNMQGTTGVSQVLSALLDGVCYGVDRSRSALLSTTKGAPGGSGWSLHRNFTSPKGKRHYLTISTRYTEEYITAAYYSAMQRTGALSQTGTSYQMDTCQMPGSCSMQHGKGATVSVWAAGHDIPSGKLATLPTKPRNIALNPSTKSIFMMRGDG